MRRFWVFAPERSEDPGRNTRNRSAVSPQARSEAGARRPPEGRAQPERFTKRYMAASLGPILSENPRFHSATLVARGTAPCDHLCTRTQPAGEPLGVSAAIGRRHYTLRWPLANRRLGSTAVRRRTTRPQLPTDYCYREHW